MFQNIHHSPSKNYSVGKIREKKLITPQQIRKKNRIPRNRLQRHLLGFGGLKSS